MADRRRIKVVKADWSEVVLVCRKCSKKLQGGFGPAGDQSLRKALSRLGTISGPRSGKPGKRRRRGLAVFDVGCQDLCPKNAVVAARPVLPRRWFVIPKGMPVEAIAAEIGLRPGTAPPDGAQPVEPGSEPDDCRLGDPSPPERSP